MQLNRLFFALWPEATAREACRDAARQLNIRLASSGRLTSAERYHLTLLFLGDQVPAAREAAAIEAAGRVQAPPFTLTLDQAGSFKNREVPWWLGPREAPPELGLLHERLREALQRAGVPPERMRFVPHLTIVREAAQILPPTPVAPISWDVREFVLIRSRLDLQPMRYEIVGRWPLRADAPPPSPAKPQLDLGF